MPSMCESRPGARPHQRVAIERGIHQHRLHLREWEGRHGPRREAGRILDLLCLRDASRGRLQCSGDLVRIAPPIARDERHDRSLVADEHERLHDLLELAAGGLGRSLGRRRSLGELVDAGLDTRRAQERRNPLHGLWPGRRHVVRLAERTVSRHTGRGGSAPARSTRHMSGSGRPGSAPRHAT